MRTCGCPIPGLPAATYGFTPTRAMIRLVALRLTYLVISKLLSRIALLGGAESAKASRYSYMMCQLPIHTAPASHFARRIWRDCQSEASDGTVRPASSTLLG
jgi:hypothetical protein